MSAGRRADFAYWAAVAIALAVLFVSGATQHRDDVIGHSDFSYIWAGPRTILDRGDPYDVLSWSASVRTLGTEPFDDPRLYSYPPYVAVALLPLAGLPLAMAAGLWTWGGIAAAVVALRLLLRAVAPGECLIHGLAAAALLLSQAAVISFFNGQWSFLLVAALSLAAAAQGRVPRGAALAMLAAKPQIGLTILAGFALRAIRRRELATAVVLVAPWVAIVGATGLLAARWSIDWLADVPGERSAEPHITTLAAAFGPLVAIVVVALALAVAVAADPRRVETIALWVTFAFLAAPYTRSYDQLLLVVPIVLLAPRRPALALSALISLLIVPWLLFLVVAPALGAESILVVVPLAIFGLVVIAGRPWSVIASSEG